MQKVIQYSIGLVIAGLLFTLGSCTSQYDKLLKSTDSELKYKKAGEYYAAKKYEKAATLYEQSAMYYRGTPQDDSLNFFLAKSYYNAKDVYSAEYYLEQFRNTFPRSPFAEEAAVLYIESIYAQTFRYELDQSPTHKTLTAIEEFYYMYPRSESKERCETIQKDLLHRLDQKQYEAAKLYYTTSDYKSATTALRTTLKDFPDSQYREDILYLLVASAYKYAELSYRHKQKDRYQAVIDEYYNFVSEFPDSKYRKEVEKWHTESTTQVNTGRKERVKEEQE